jgi:hypothetical protein
MAWIFAQIAPRLASMALLTETPVSRIPYRFPNSVSRPALTTPTMRLSGPSVFSANQSARSLAVMG